MPAIAGTAWPHPHLSRRQFIGAAGVTAAAATLYTTGTLGPTTRAKGSGHQHGVPTGSAPNPIPVTVDGGAVKPFDQIHWLLPGPDGSTTPFIGLPGFGLDVDPATITDYRGYTAYAVIAGTAKGSDGEMYNCEFDVRVMQGNYVGEDAKRHHGTFGFF